MKYLKKRKLLAAIIAAAAWLLLSGVNASASSWVTSNGHCFYVTTKGRWLTGLHKIRKHKYYFDAGCIQRTGWRKIGSYYYYFRPYAGKKGYMVTGKTIDGIQLLKNGRAVVNARAAKKLPVLVTASSWLDSLTTETMTPSQKRKKCFYYIVNNCADLATGDYFNGNANWDTDYASLLYSRRAGDCFVFACGAAYLFNACGYANVQICSTGMHCWIEQRGLYYDPHWTGYGGATVYAMPASLSGVGKHPAIAGTALYRVNIDKA